ncbi:fasciclin domain-containing protein [Dokdonia sinensis]|uniref:Fasciclin domain-containing protein n=1 Tax=Dokdonia sinensis TaxID=2479847 RepID=A0A3M0G5X8_9FLAO|nr:fasciclin domain-containing protein [Dokdonia sinensis]RMB59497.1 fasciclin domain-containing protein [Dokdonia sinensis]
MKLYRKLPIVLLLAGAFAFTACGDDKKKEEQIKLETQKKADEEKAQMAMKEEEDKKKMKAEATANSIAAKAMGNDNLSTLVAAVKAADLAAMLSEPGNYTVFAPINSAFEKLPKGTVESLLMPENKEMLTGILQYHVVKGTINAEKLSSAIKAANGKYSFKTVKGSELTAMMDGDQIVIQDSRGKKAQVVLGNVEASNGIVHVIDNVLMEKK